jgi:moderate conductance mechanosensitive channel
MSSRPRPVRGVVLILAVLLALALPVGAQTPATPPASAPPSADELQHLLDTVQDPAQRQQLVQTLQSLIAVERGNAAKPAETLPATLFETLSAQIDVITGEILAAAQLAVDAPRLVSWIETQASNEAARDFWLAIILRLVVIFGLGIIAELLARLVLRTPARKLAQRPGATTVTRIILTLLAIVIEIIPIAVFAAAASLTVPFTQPIFGTRQVARVLIGAILWARLVLAAIHALLLSPSASGLCALDDETKNYLYIWARRFTNWSVYGFALAAAAWWLGVPGAVYALLLRGTALGLAILAIIFVLQNRKAVADWLRGGAEGDGWRLIRHRLADTWHVLAIVYVVGTFSVYVLDIAGGYLFLLRATVLTAVVLLAATLLVRFVERLSRQGFAIAPAVKTRYPTLEARANRYLPVLFYVTSFVIYAFAALALLQAWGIDAFAWLDTDAGRRATGTIVTTAIVVAGALVAWEVFSSAIERYLHASDGRGRRSARARTLLPLLRTSVLVVIIVMVGLMVLSEVGVNIAPLLAGAGVVGLAVGFGSQALVKDLITGLFILAEDTLAVGDVVDVGKGAGVVEAISIRTIRLRDDAGTLQTVPFSEVTTVKNMTREFAYALHDVGVLFREDADRVIAVLRAVAQEMAADPAWSSRVLAPLDVYGLVNFTDSAQVIRVRLKTAPLQQWLVHNEFNRRLKKAFDAHGIEMPAANQTHYLEPPSPPQAEPQPKPQA